MKVRFFMHGFVLNLFEKVQHRFIVIAEQFVAIQGYIFGRKAEAQHLYFAQVRFVVNGVARVN